MKTIVVATDFSPCSRTAVQLAVALAHRLSSRLLLVHAVEPPPLDLPAVPIGASAWESELLTAAQLDLTQQVSEIRQSGLQVETRVEVQLPSGFIVEVAKQAGAALIVLGTHGRKGAAHLFLGSVAEHVLRTAAVPVLVTREGANPLPRWDGREPLRLAVGIDGPAVSVAALAWVGQFSDGHPCEVLLAHVYSPREEAIRYGLDEPWGELPREADLVPLLERDLRRQAKGLIEHVPARVRLCAADQHAEEVLAREASTAGVDALVIGVPKHRSRGSLSAGAVLRRSTVPVFCIPEGAVPADRKLPEVRSVLIATDLSDASNAVVPSGYGLLRPAGGRVELLTVHELGPAEDITGTPAVLPLRAEEKEAIAAQLRALAPQEVDAFDITTRVSVVEARRAAEAIIAAAERLGVDVIVVGSHGRSGFGRMLLGSVAEEVARRSTRPVLIVRAGRKKT